MKKRILLSLLIMSPAFTHGMENSIWSIFTHEVEKAIQSIFSITTDQLNEDFLDSISYLPSWLSNQSQLTSDLRVSKVEFMDELRCSILKRSPKYPLRTFFGTYKIDHFDFFLYCYCHKSFPENIFIDLRQCGISHHALDQCKAVHIKSYSALGATMIARKTSFKEKYEFIQELLKHGFTPTQKDIGLANIMFYDLIVKQSKPMLYILYSQADWSVLPQEIRTQIAHCMLQLFKNEFCLLPETTLNDL